MQREWMDLRARVAASASAVGGKEGEGPLGELFDLCDPSGRFGAATWESAESEMQRLTFQTALSKAGWRDTDVGALFAGDLLNQCVGSAYGLLGFDVPYFGLYGACSTSAEGLLLASAVVSGGFFRRCGVVTSSHFCPAERQYRTPLEYGAQRPPTAQWTVTGAGAFLLDRPDDGAPGGNGVLIRRGMPGKVLDMGIRDANNMGAAMAPAALDTLVRFFRATGESPDGFDRVITGDLGYEGGAILCDLMEAEGFSVRDRYDDCGRLVFDRKRQDVHSGGSGCGCAASVLSACVLPKIRRREWNRVLFLATGAMMSPDSLKQGRNIPAVAHLLEFVSF